MDKYISYIIRHAEAKGNRNGILLGQVDPPLTKYGVKQAMLLANRLKRLNFDGLVSSDLVRAASTASLIARECQLPITLTEALREANYGVIDGWHSRKIEASEYGAARQKSKYMYRAPLGESYKDIEERVIKAISKPPFLKTLFVTHQGPIRVILHVLGGYDEKRAASEIITHFDAVEISYVNESKSARLIRDFV